MKTIAIQPVRGDGNARPASKTVAPPWRLLMLMQAPHRLAFAAGAALLALNSCWWLLALLAREASAPFAWAVPMPVAHGVVMAFGFMPLFFVGFLFTAGPRWLGLPPVDPRRLVVATAGYAIAWALYLPAVHLSVIAASACVALAAAAWTALAWRFARMVAASTVPDRVHAKLVAAAALVGAVALWTIAFALASESWQLLRAAVLTALWGCLALTYLAVAHRMIPFFTSSALPFVDAWRPLWLLGVFVAASMIGIASALVDLVLWPVPPALRVLQLIGEAALGAGLLALALRWGLVQSLRVRLLAMLHAGFVWLGTAFALQAVSHALLLFSDGQHSLGLAPLHALTMGFMGATLVAMATRVSAGHSGRHLTADNLVWTLFWIQQAATIVRIVAASWPGAPSWLTACAALLWTIATLTWALRCLNWYGRPRIDGAPG